MKRKPPEHVNHERWLVSYADLITLLFALFVILYAMSKADVEKLKKVQQSMLEAFGDAKTSEVKTEPSPTPSAEASPVADAGGVSQARDAIKQSLALESGVANVADKVELAEDDRGLVVRLAARDFFDDGMVEAQADLRPLLDRIAKVIASVPNAIRVEGHTDVKEDNLQKGFPSGWELSSERASWVVRYWVKRWDLDPARFTAAGLSHFHPLIRSDDDFNRGKNRRVEVIILKGPVAKAHAK